MLYPMNMPMFRSTDVYIVVFKHCFQKYTISFLPVGCIELSIDSEEDIFNLVQHDVCL